MPAKPAPARLVIPGPHFVILAKARIHALSPRERTPIATPPGGNAGIQGEGCGGSTHHRPLLVTSLEKSQTTQREKNVARSKTTRGEGLVPRLGGAQPAHTTIPHPNHPNILDTNHRYSRDRMLAPYLETRPESTTCAVRRIKFVTASGSNWHKFSVRTIDHHSRTIGPPRRPVL